jgi:hypothetical protein
MLNDAMAKVSSADREHVIGSLLLAVLVSVGELVSTRPWIYDFSRIRQVTAFAAQGQNALASVRMCWMLACPSIS